MGAPGGSLSELTRVRAAIENGSLPAEDLFLPAIFDGAPSGVPGNTSWSYSGPPAPIGVADLGVGTGGFHDYNSTSFEGMANLSALSTFSPGASAAVESPDWSSLQLNLNLDNLSEPTGFRVGWLQDVARINATEVQFVDNVWGVVGPNGTAGYGNGTSVEAIYYDAGPRLPVSFPLDLTLRVSVAVSGSAPVVRFGYQLQDPNGSWNGTFDTVTLSASVAPGSPPQFVVLGGQTDSLGLRDDAELVWGGDGGGSNAMVQTMNGTLQLDRYLSTTGTFVSVPSAYDYGTDAAESVEGVSVYYEGTTAYVSAGPSLMYGLWNTSTSAFGVAATPGWISVRLSSSVSDEFVFGTNGSATGFSSSAWVPTNGSGVARFELPPPLGGLPYRFGAWANGRQANTSVSVDSNATGSQSIGLATGGGMDTPILLQSLSQAQALVTALPGATENAGPADLWINDSVVAIASPFLQLNDVGFPLFQMFAADGLAGLRIHVLNLSLANSSFVYQMGTAGNLSLPGWTQGVYLDRVAAGSSVSNETEFGSVSGPTLPPRPSSVGVYDSTDVHVSNLTESGSGPGVVLFGDASTQVAWVGVSGPFGEALPTGESTVGVDELDSAGTNVSHLAVRGIDGVGVNSVGSKSLSVNEWSVAGDPAGGIYLCPSGAGVTSGLFGGAPGPEAIGVCLLDSNGTRISNGNATGWGATSVVASSVDGLNVSEESVDNDSVAGSVVGSENLSFWGGSVLDSPDGGWNLSNDLNVSVTGWSAEANNSNTVDWAAHDDGVHLLDLTAADNASATQFIEYSTNITAANISARNTSFAFSAFEFDANVSIRNVGAFVDSYGIAASWMTNGSVRSLAVGTASMGFLLDGGSNLTVEGVTVSDQSMGVDLNDFGNASVSDLTATDASIAVDFATGLNVSVRNVSATDVSTAVYALGLTSATVTDVNATSSLSGPLYYVNPVFDLPFTVGAVQLWLDVNTTVTNVSSLAAGYAVWDLESVNLTISGVRSWQETNAIQLNYTVDSIVSDVFSFADQMGVSLFETTNITVESSTFEDSRQWGAFVVGGVGTTAFGNNFVGNNGASENGTYDPATPQAVVANGGFGNFTWDGVGNYWSDWPGGGAYPVGTHVNDTAPVPVFISSWLRFTETGLTPGLVWAVEFLGVNYSFDNPLLDLPNRDLPSSGSAPFTVAPPAGWHATPPQGTVEFGGGNTTVSIVFGEPGFRVQFNASGLPDGTEWNVSINGVEWRNSTVNGQGVIGTTLPNGTYPYQIGAIAGFFEGSIPYSGSVVVHGANVTRELMFALEQYVVTFDESGLPAGTSWSVQFNQSVQRVTGEAASFSVPNGTYGYRVTTAAGWLPTNGNYSGTVSVAGANRSVAVGWRPARYAVSFHEVGLGSGVEWSVTLGGTLLTGDGPFLNFSVGNGSYAFQVTLAAGVGYTISPSTGSVTVNGTASSVTVTFGAAAPSSTSSSVPWTWVLVGAGVAAIAAGLVVWRLRRRPAEDAPSTHPDHP